MNRIDIMERLYELKSISEGADTEKVITLLDDIIRNKVSEESAELELRKIDPYYVRHEFLKNLKNKPIYKNIVEYKKGNLSNVQIAKIISSLITQILIQSEQNDEINIKSLQIDVLADMIKDYADNPDRIDFDKLDFILDKFGWSDSDDS